MTTAKKSAARSTPSKTSGSSSKKASPKRNTSTRTRGAGHSSSSETARKTGKKTAKGQAWTDERSENKSSTGHGRAKRQPAKQDSHCWPGYEPVPGKSPGEKGSCKPKARQTAAEKKSDAMAAAANKLRKG